MTSSEWIGLEIICYYCIYSTPRWAGSISPGGSVWISSTIVQYSIQLSKFCLHNVTLLCYSICTCCVTSLYFVSSAPYLPSDSWNGEIAVLKFQASAPLQLFHTGGYILFNCRRWKYLWPRSFSRQLWGKYCGILAQHGVMAWQTKEGLSFLIRIRSIHMVSCKLSIVHPKSLFAVVCSF